MRRFLLHQLNNNKNKGEVTDANEELRDRSIPLMLKYYGRCRWAPLGLEVDETERTRSSFRSSSTPSSTRAHSRFFFFLHFGGDFLIITVVIIFALGPLCGFLILIPSKFQLNFPPVSLGWKMQIHDNLFPICRPWQYIAFVASA